MTTRANVRRLAVVGVLLLSACGPTPSASPALPPAARAARVRTARVPHPIAAAPVTGGWITVTATNVAGAPCGPLRAWRRCADAKLDAVAPMRLQAAGDLQRVSDALDVGIYHFYFKAPGHVLAREYDAIWQGQTTTLAAVFEPIGTNVRVITGVVLDAMTRQPLAGVALRDTSTRAFYAVTEWTPVTDTAGTFRVMLGDDQLTLRFTHAGYLAGAALFPARQGMTNVIVCLSPPARLRITARHADGTPVSNATAVVFGAMRRAVEMRNGSVVFSNVPAGVALRFVLQRHDRCLIGGTVAPLAPHSSTNVMVQLQRPGRLVLRFSEPIFSNAFGTSVCVECRELVTNRPPGSFDSRDFVAQADTWVMADLSPATYLVRLHGTNTVELSTNVVICSEGDTILDLCAGANSLGVIAGSVDDGTAAPVTFSVRAVCADTPHIVTTVDVDDTNVFSVAGLDLRHTYNVRVSAVVGFSITNVVVADVRPNSAALRIVLDRAYVVRGTVVDQHGVPVKLTTDNWGLSLLHAEPNGRFVYGPVPAGPCRLSLRAQGYAPYFQEVLIEQDDVDLGTITLTRGVTISGRVLDDHGKPCADVNVVVVCMPCASFGDLVQAVMAGTQADDDGYFCASNVTPDVRCSVAAGRNDDQWVVTPALTPQADYNVGTIYLRRPPWYEITFRAPDGSVLHDVEVLGLKQDHDDPDVWKGKEPPTIALFNAVLMMPTSPQFARHLAFLNATFVPCPTGYAPTNRMTIDVPLQWYRQHKDLR